MRSTSLREPGSKEAVPEASHNKGVVLKTLLMKALPLALSLVVAFLLAVCGGAGSGQQGDDSGGGGHSQMGHGSMGMGSGGMARQMVMKNGNYSDKAFIDAMVSHHQSAIEMAEVAYKKSENSRIKELAGSIISAQ
jgi:predicted outer membrane protein